MTERTETDRGLDSGRRPTELLAFLAITPGGSYVVSDSSAKPGTAGAQRGRQFKR